MGIRPLLPLGLKKQSASSWIHTAVADSVRPSFETRENVAVVESSRDDGHYYSRIIGRTGGVGAASTASLFGARSMRPGCSRLLRICGIRIVPVGGIEQRGISPVRRVSPVRLVIPEQPVITASRSSRCIIPHASRRPFKERRGIPGPSRCSVPRITRCARKLPSAAGVDDATMLSGEMGNHQDSNHASTNCQCFHELSSFRLRRSSEGICFSDARWGAHRSETAQTPRKSQMHVYSVVWSYDIVGRLSPA